MPVLLLLAGFGILLVATNDAGEDRSRESVDETVDRVLKDPTTASRAVNVTGR
jgi:hypothetical protein